MVSPRMLHNSVKSYRKSSGPQALSLSHALRPANNSNGLFIGGEEAGYSSILGPPISGGWLFFKLLDMVS